MSFRLLLALLCLPAFAPWGASVRAQGIPVKLDLSRRDLKNFLTDTTALAPYRNADGGVQDLRDAFTFGAVDLPYAVFWDPHACRLVGILDIEAAKAGQPAPAGADRVEPATQPYLLKAAGAFPLAKTPGASEGPRYFGFRLVNGAPEFLYRCGSLAIEERLWLDDGGRTLRQRFFAKEATGGLQISIPDDWKGRVEASAGTWKGSVLSLPKGSSEVVLSYALAPPEAPEPTPSDSN